MAKTNVWMSVSDLMTGLMVIFLFVSIAYMHRAQQLNKEKELMLSDYVDTKQQLRDKLEMEFRQEIGQGTMAIGNDLTMRFTKAESLFGRGDWHITPQFASMLSAVIPSYLQILLADSLRNSIKEIRIEGHTDTIPFPALDADPYMANLKLSQNRARSVIEYIRNMPEYTRLSEEDRKQVDFWLTANGYSYSRALNHDGEFAKDVNEIDCAKSRRVEIRLITDDYRVLENLIRHDK